MNSLRDIINIMLEAIGWTMIHSFWQFLILFAILKLVLFSINKAYSKLRYAVACSFLIIAVLCTILTFVYEYKTYDILEDTTYRFQKVQTVEKTLLPTETISSEGPDFLTVSLSFLDSISTYLAYGWAIGIIFFSIKLINANQYLKRLRRLKSEIYPDVMKSLAQISKKMGVSKKITLIINNSVSEPLTFGWLRPIILLPCSCIAQIPLSQLEMIIAHELAHIKRNDFLVNIIQSCLEAIYFFNPFLIVISKTIRNEREFCCDDMAIKFTGDDETMAVALANLKYLVKYPSLAMSAKPTRSVFYERIARLLGSDSASKITMKNSFIGMICLFFLIFIFTKCVDDTKYKLPQSDDKITQVWTDNQSSAQVDIYTYQKGGKEHDFFLISSSKRNPSYAFLDGTKLRTDEIEKVAKVLKRQDSLLMANVMISSPDINQVNMEKIMNLDKQLDSINTLLFRAKAQMRVDKSTALESRYNSLAALSNSTAKALKDISLKDYQRQARNIPAEIEIHKILTNIIKSGEYTSDNRKRLNSLIKYRQ